MKSWTYDMKTTRWSHGIFGGEITVSDQLPDGYALIGWTKAPFTCYILFRVWANLGIWRPEVKLAYGFLEAKC